MVKDLVDQQEPKGVPVPLGNYGNVEAPAPRQQSGRSRVDIEVPSKRLRSMHRRSGTSMSLKEWVHGLKGAVDTNLVHQWYRNKRRQRE